MHISEGGAYLLSMVAGFAMCGCSAIEPVDQYNVRFTGYEADARIASGASSATDGRQETPLYGDQLDASDDLALSASPGQRALVEVRLSNDSDLRATFDRFHDFEGHQNLDRQIRFDGTTYAAGTFVNTDLDWNRTTFTYGHRIASFRGEGAPVDLVLRLGAERDQWMTKVTGFPPPGRDRFQIAGAPLAGLEANVGLVKDVVLTLGADGGGVNHADKRLIFGDATIGLRWNVVGPFDVTAGYEFSTRHQTTRRGDGEHTDVRLTGSVFLIGFGLHF